MDCGAEFVSEMATGSFSVWIKAPPSQNANARVLEIGTTASRIGLFLANGKVCFYSYPPAYLFRITSGATTVTNNAWHHIVAMWDSTAANRRPPYVTEGLHQ